jgi:hypothetical protein
MVICWTPCEKCMSAGYAYTPAGNCCCCAFRQGYNWEAKCMLWIASKVHRSVRSTALVLKPSMTPRVSMHVCLHDSGILDLVTLPQVNISIPNFWTLNIKPSSKSRTIEQSIIGEIDVGFKGIRCTSRQDSAYSLKSSYEGRVKSAVRLSLLILYLISS